MEYQIRPAAVTDCEAIVSLIRGLAVYEHLEDQMINTPQRMEQVLFEEKAARAMVCEADGAVVGYCIYFYSNSTFIGKKGIWLEDLYVLPEYRGHGIGKAFFKALADTALNEDCMRLEWSVLNWNAPSIAFYEKLGSVAMSDWHTRRLDRSGIENLVKKL